ncbi:hypothetical protein F5J12DRAFT_831184 [Pisolithus orientalis]|uniref:uncharacterized protein n=1 Tax=Pisolithus orientalis TaxID=936130 RepID=UPI002223FA77|nr:uncharacterized protein F5J12DRAFT_831184 [Pisolithus orientalis]KAI6006509.1 hypothetical protein F5J12DRAFT_831184 [Pisolithus orientalis]
MSIPGEFGVMLVGGLVSAMLYGITILQTYVYYMHYSEDSSIMKFIVAAIWILDTSHLLISECLVRPRECMANGQLP